MPRLSKMGSLVVTCCVLLGVTAAVAAVPSESLLPNTTKGYASVPSVDKLVENWNKTSIGQLLNDPIMQPFVEDLREQLKKKWGQTHQKLGLTIDDLQGATGGEVAVALIQPSKKEVAVVLLADITDHREQAQTLLNKIYKNLLAQQAKQSVRQIGGTQVTVFDIPKHEHTAARQALFFIREEMLCATDNLSVAEGILSRFAAPGDKNSLSALTSFDAVMKRCGAAVGPPTADLRWFIDPFGYAEATRAANPQHNKRKGPDPLKILKDQGFTAVKAAGGYVNFAFDEYEILHRTAIYAPPTKADGYELAMRMLDFPNGGDLEPGPWVPREIATYASFNWNIKKAFEASKTLVNEVVGDEVFDDVLRSIKEDPNGPQIDIRKDLIGHLGDRATVISDYHLPITPKSERILFAAVTTDEAALVATIDKSMRTDENAKRHEFNGHVIWEITDEQTDVPMVTIENTPDADGDTPDFADEKETKLPNSAVTVAYGHLFISTHIDFLMKVLAEAEEGEKLAQSSDFQLVSQELQKLVGGEQSVKLFSRTDEEYRALYELVRQGRMPEAETMLGRLLNYVLSDGTTKDGVPRAAAIDGSKLPEYDAVRRYFGPAGTSITTEKDGWFVTGFTLTKQVPQQAAAAAVRE